MAYRHGFIVPLVGGQAIAQAEVLGSRPDFLQSFSAFADNDAHIRAWWPDVPFDVLDVEARWSSRDVDVVGSTCPCAGLSTMSTSSCAGSKTNDWMYRVATHVLGTLRPRVYWGENAPGLSSQMGAPVAMRLRQIGREYGYTFSMYRTKSTLHGLPQLRQRTFYFFWRDLDGEVPVLPWVQRPFVSIEDWFKVVRPVDALSGVWVRDCRPTDEPVYRFLLEHYDCDHPTFLREHVRSTTSVPAYVTHAGLLDAAVDWCAAHNEARAEKSVRWWRTKHLMGSGVMERYLILPRHHIGAFVGPYTWCMAHPHEDRFLSLREMEDMMGMPVGFTLLDVRARDRHLTQNVPVQTARDVACIVKAYLDGELAMTDTRQRWLVFDNMRRTVYAWPAAD